MLMNRAMHHVSETYGQAGNKWAQEVYSYMKGGTILDYGCGKGNLAKSLPFLSIDNYDPCIEGLDEEPEAHDYVVCTDVLEHVEPRCIDAVLKHIASLMRTGAFLVIATRPANKNLPDGRNAHLIVEHWEWWEKLISRYFVIRRVGHNIKEKGEIAIWVSPLESS